jgi:hypothetical protein
VAVAGSGYVFTVMIKCGTVTIGSTPLVAINDCPYNGRDIFIVRTGDAPPAFQSVSDLPDPVAAFHKMAEYNLEIYPNPATDQLHINLPENDTEITLFIQNQFGQTVWSEKFESQRRNAIISLDGQGFQSGMYYLICPSNGEVETKQFVVDK